MDQGVCVYDITISKFWKKKNIQSLAQCIAKACMFCRHYRFHFESVLVEMENSVGEGSHGGCEGQDEHMFCVFKLMPSNLECAKDRHIVGAIPSSRPHTTRCRLELED